MDKLAKGARAALLDLMVRVDPLDEVATRHKMTAVELEALARSRGVQPETIRLRRNKVSPDIIKRDRRAAGMYLDGLMMAQIGEALGITGERIRQILQPMGASGASRLEVMVGVGDAEEEEV